MAAELKPIDVICQHSRDEKITPIKIRVVDEDGEYQEYRIKGSVRAGHTDDAGRRVREQHYPDI